MSDENKQPESDEAKVEAEVQSQVTEDELRADLADKLGLDPDEQSELLDKLTERELDQREKLSSAIKQKINWREKAQAQENSGKSEQSKAQTDIKTLSNDDLSSFKQELKEELALEQMDLPEEIQEEVKKLAKLNNVSVREAVNDPYVQFKLDQIEHKEKIDNATPRRTYRGSQATRTTELKPPNPKDHDLTTEEGRKSWEAAKKKFHEARKK